MKCLKHHAMILYIDQALPDRVMKKAEAHLSTCPECQVNLEKAENNLRMVMKKMELLEPGSIPAAEFVFRPTKKPSRKLRLFQLLRDWKWKPILKPAYIAVVFLFISLLAMILVIQSPHPGEKDPASSLSISNNQFAIHFIKIEEKPAQTYIVTEQETRTTLVWVEKMQ